MTGLRGILKLHIDAFQGGLPSVIPKETDFLNDGILKCFVPFYSTCPRGVIDDGEEGVIRSDVLSDEGESIRVDRLASESFVLETESEGRIPSPSLHVFRSKNSDL